tara:strand:+ start:169 stop:606 length:438 start_codon:yes stop_codon:yes gene_type:complete
VAIIDTSKKQIKSDRDENVFIGINLPFQKSDGVEGWFLSSKTTVEAVRNNVRLFMQTKAGERLMQPNIGLGLEKYLFEPLDNTTQDLVRKEIEDKISFWMPFINIVRLDVNIDEASTHSPHTMFINVEFTINGDQTTLSSVQVEV